MDQDHLHKLAQKFLEGTATDVEKAQLHEWYDQNGTFPEIPEDADILRLRMLQAIDRRTAGRSRWYRRMAAAAAVLLLITAGGYFFFADQPAQTAENTGHYKHDVAPGGNKATLTLGDGSIIELDSAQNGALGSQGNTQVIKLAGAQLAYDNGNAGNQAVFYYNTVNTPRGGQYQIILPDGSKVWLNAVSSLRFPTAFSGKERKVELTGEAFFDIAHNENQPFIVAVDKMEVEVLGTQFNIMAYANESSMKTSLLRGAVKVRSEGASSLLKPGQQARLHKNGDLKVIDLPYAEETAAWKDGLFLFNNEDLDAIMRRISRWYNVDVAFTTENIKTQTFTGQISRQEKLSEVLKMLELTEAVHFGIENRTVTVKP
ncbi:FecR family protein [Chitinophaga sp. XS-30]|uniref:FecR family protein n=1 Tax=Chitinophaga sp. XS-30 TaxID=2604421 RepID=UPI0011DE35AC|nr:FecR family protein [Chitinophaga sp. XS-30]QEH42298.1 FecR family protein [Chitinophaga sp. XS-30]